MHSHTDKQTPLVVPPPVSTGDLSLAHRLRSANPEIRQFFRASLANAIFLQETATPDMPPVALAAVESPAMPGQVVPLIARVTDGAVYVEADDRARMQWTRDGRVPANVDFARYARLLAFREVGDMAAWTVLDSRCSRVLPALDDLAEATPEDMTARANVEM